jgi:hypothetical protein
MKDPNKFCKIPAHTNLWTCPLLKIYRPEYAQKKCRKMPIPYCRIVDDDSDVDYEEDGERLVDTF